MKEKKYGLQNRLIDFAVNIIKLAEKLPNSKIGNHVRGQMLKSGTSPAPNYGEAQAAESRSDFIHKLKIALKELRETQVWLIIIISAELIKYSAFIKSLLSENDELISILFSSIKTAGLNEKAKIK